jgi:hypothetical protein
VTVPAVPDPARFVPARAEKIAADVVAWVEQADDLEAIAEAHARLLALEEYLVRRDSDQAGPIQAAARRSEARIGQLLGTTTQGQRHDLTSPHAVKLHGTRRQEFRAMAEYLGRWWPDEARQSRAAVLRVVETAKGGKAKRWRELEARDKAARAAVLAEQPADARGDQWAVLNGRFQDRLAHLDGSVDVVVTDPPYARDALELWADLAVFASRALRPGGVLLGLTGQILFPQVLEALDAHLTYGWTFAVTLPGANSRVITRRVAQEWKPIVAYAHGSWPQWMGWHGDLLTQHAGPYDRVYEWEQDPDPMRELVEWLAPPGALVCDPMVGVGTYGLAALKAGCRFIGCELDTERATTAATRLTEQAS